MAVQGKCSMTLSLPGTSISATVSRPSSGGVQAQEVTLPAAVAGTLTTRTDNGNGTLTMGANHGITDGQILAIFGPTSGVTYFATVGTVSGNSVPFTAADAGDVLPANNSAVTVDVITDLNVDFDGDNLEILGAMMDRRGLVVFEDAGNTVIDGQELTANEPYLYISGGMTGNNPLAGNAVDQVKIANGDSTANATFKMGGTYNSQA
jgi:hypothetical protein